MSSTILQRENEFKNIYSKTCTRCRQITNKAPEYRNSFELGKPIKIGPKVLLENQAKGLLKSKKLLELRSGPYTVTKQITNTFEIVHDSTEQKKVVQRNHLVEYSPKEQEIDKLEDYSTNYDDSKAYYDRFSQYSINRFNHQTIDNPEYMPWPIFNNANNQAEQHHRNQLNTQLLLARAGVRLTAHTKQIETIVKVYYISEICLPPKVVHKVLHPILIHLAVSLVQPPPSKNET